MIHWSPHGPGPGLFFHGNGVTSSNASANVMGIYNKVFRVHSYIYNFLSIILNYRVGLMTTHQYGKIARVLMFWPWIDEHPPKNITMDNLYEYETIIIYELFWRVAILDSNTDFPSCLQSMERSDYTGVPNMRHSYATLKSSKMCSHVLRVQTYFFHFSTVKTDGLGSQLWENTHFPGHVSS